MAATTRKVDVKTFARDSRQICSEENEDQASSGKVPGSHAWSFFLTWSDSVERVCRPHEESLVLLLTRRDDYNQAAALQPASNYFIPTAPPVFWPSSGLTSLAMFRACIGKSKGFQGHYGPSDCNSYIASRPVASSSSSSSKYFHTSVVCQIAKRRTHRSGKKSNEAIHKERARSAEANRPHVVLGTRPNDSTKWSECDLAKLLVKSEEIEAQGAPRSQPSWQAGGVLEMPERLNFGVTEAEKKMLFENLPALSAERTSYQLQNLNNSLTPTSWMVAEYAKGERLELHKANMLAKVIDLRNANARGIAYENRRRCVLAFSEPDNPSDPGRPEVQGACILSPFFTSSPTYPILLPVVALLTMKIRNLWTHLNKFKRDVGNRRSLRKLVHERAKILKYLKRLDRDRYDSVLTRLGLEAESVEGELVV
jgi:small subunit ribosomal protein S15